MPLLEPPPAVPDVLRNELAHLQLEIARRADALARSAAPNQGSDLELWIRAEIEVFARHGPKGNSASPMGLDVVSVT